MADNAAALSLPSVVTKGEAVYNHMRHLILLGELAPGSTLQQERLAADLGLSTTPLREALRRLEGEGLVSLDRNRRVRIAELSRTELDQIYEVRVVLDPLAAGLAARKLSDTELDEIAMMARAPMPAEVDHAEALRTNRAFHRAIYAGSGNDVLIDTLDSLWDRGDRYRIHLMYDSSDLDDSRKDHIAIADALVARSASKVSRLMKEHVAKSQALIPQRARMLRADS